MKMERLREITEKVGKYATGERLDITFIAGTDRLWLSAKSDTDEKYEKLNDVLAEYKDEFIRIEHHRLPDWSLDSQYLERIDFFDLCDKMAQVIEADINVLIASAPVDPIYAFVVGTTPEHYSIENFANSEAEWDRHNTDSADKYWSPEFTLDAPMAERKHWEPLLESLAKVEEIVSEYFDVMGDIGMFKKDYERRFTQMAVHALKRKMHLFEKLNTTEDFVSYVQDPCGHGDDVFSALETVPIEKVKEMYSLEYDEK